VTQRVYVPLDRAALERLAAGELGPPPLDGYAATDALRGWYDEGARPGADDELLEAVAAALAAQASLAGLDASGSARLVAAVDVSEVRPDESEQPGRVRLDAAVPLRDVAAVLADGPDAADDVRAAVSDPSDEHLDAVERHGLAWWGPAEVSDLAAQLTG
jgi:hypothetical protein